MGTISISDRNDQPGGIRFKDEKDEILIDLATVSHRDWRRFTVLDGHGSSWNLGELVEESLERERQIEW